MQTVSRVLGSRREAGSCAAARRSVVAATAAAKTSMQFIKGNAESCVPDVKLTRARDGSSGTAVFFFESPDVFEAGFAEQAGGDITGLYLVDEEGTLSTVDVSAKFVNGKPKGIEARYTMKSAFEWDRFMRFMERYAEDHGACVVHDVMCVRAAQHEVTVTDTCVTCGLQVWASARARHEALGQAQQSAVVDELLLSCCAIHSRRIIASSWY